LGYVRAQICNWREINTLYFCASVVVWIYHRDTEYNILRTYSIKLLGQDSSNCRAINFEFNVIAYLQ
jgi:hypothetical protein